MSSKPTDSQELKLGPGWTSLSKHAAHPPSNNPSSTIPPPNSAAPPRISYTKAQLLDFYEPGTTAAIPSTMHEYPGITSSEPLVPVNIAPDDDIAHVSSLAENSLATASEPSPPRSRFQSVPAPRPGVEAILGRDHPQSSAGPPASVSPPDAPAPIPLKKPGHVSSSNRDFWSGSAVLAAAERPNPTGPPSERRPLALKPRSTTERAISPNGHPTEKPSTGQQPPYWSRGSARGGADSNSNWRGGISTGGAKYPGSSLDDVTGATMTTSVGTSAQNAPARKSTSEMGSSHFSHGGGSASMSRSTFGREGGLFSRNNKDTLKPTNTRDLTVLAKGSSRETNSAPATSHHDRESRDSRQHGGPDTQAKAKPDIANENERTWYYRDPQGNIQGPFTGSQLIQWEKEGYYDSELPVSKSTDGDFKPLAIAFGMRKEEPAVAAPPPGFNGTTASKKEAPVATSPMSMRPSREERSRRGVRTVEDMAQEVEKMRLVNRNKRIGKKTVLSDDNETPVDGEKSFFDTDVTSPKDANGHSALKESIDETQVEPSSLVQPTSDVQDGDDEAAVAAPSIVTAKDVLKPDSSIKQSRFAAFMKQEKEVDVNRAAAQISSNDLNEDMTMTRSVPATPRARGELATNHDDSTRFGESKIAQGERDETQNTVIEQATPWNTVMMGLQEHPSQGAPAALPSMPAAASDQDIMAIDPAIAHASFARPPIVASSPVQPPIASTAEVSSWLPFSSSVDTGVLNAHDPVLETSQHVQAHGSIPVPLTHHEQAQLHARAQARAQAQARAEAYRQAHVQAQVQAQQRQIQAQSQVQQAQAARAAAVQHASAIAQAQSQSQDPVWILKQRLAQLQVQFDVHYRANIELSHTAQAAQVAMNSAIAGSVEFQRARSVLLQSQAAMKEHNLQMDRIKYAATTTHAHIVNHQNAAAREQQQRQIHAQAPHPSPESHGTMSPHSMTKSETQSPKQVSRNGSMPLNPNNTPINLEQVKAAGDLEQARVADVIERVAEELPNAKRNLNSSYDALAASEGWEKVTRNAKENLEARRANEEENTQTRNRHGPVQGREAHIAEGNPGMSGTLQTMDGSYEIDADSKAILAEAVHRETLIGPNSPERPPTEALPTIAPWSKSSAANPSSNGLSLREIQRQELRSKADEKTVTVQQERDDVSKGAGGRWIHAAQPWGGAGDPTKHPTLSLREIEEEQKKKKASHVAREGGSLTGNAQGTGPRPLGTKTGWASIAAKNSAPTVRRPTTATVVGKRMDEETPFWDSVGSQPHVAAGQPSRPTRPVLQRSLHTTAQNHTAVAARQPIPKAPSVSATARKAPVQGKPNKSESREAAPEENVVIGGRISHEFGNWCAENLQKLTGEKSPDTMLCEYLVTIPSAAEIKETILQNLGANDRTRSFADEFVRRLEFERTSVVADAGTGGNTGRKKGRRHRPSKVDPSLVLGFTSTSSRIMQGTIETPEMK